MSAPLINHATRSIDVGSKSFAAAARLFDRSTRHSVVMLYCWCRYCDDVVDGQVLGHRPSIDEQPHDPAERLEQLRTLTAQAYAGEPMIEPAFSAFQHVVRRHAIPASLPLEHLAGFAMDVEGRHYRTIEETLEYCYHVAGVVGIMMAKVMGVHDRPVLDRACDLGIAFQLTNIVRDIVEDAAVGRLYLPEDWLTQEGVSAHAIAAAENRAGVARVAARMLDLADQYYESAAGGISALPLRSAWAIATARGVYRSIGRAVLARGTRAWDTRTVTSRIQKVRHAASGGAVAMASRFRPPPPAFSGPLAASCIASAAATANFSARAGGAATLPVLSARATESAQKSHWCGHWALAEKYLINKGIDWSLAERVSA